MGTKGQYRGGGNSNKLLDTASAALIEHVDKGRGDGGGGKGWGLRAERYQRELLNGKAQRPALGTKLESVLMKTTSVVCCNHITDVSPLMGEPSSCSASPVLADLP